MLYIILIGGVVLSAFLYSLNQNLVHLIIGSIQTGMLIAITIYDLYKEK